ncbi:insulinase family protein [Flagellimonas hymeniacidonis]|uniref:Insulinase family protein n=1 Tax=Flagellimonas hymeniacidonis TaxID=2603628 RepID=A0A5C8V1L9_9FLAO|nr:M16 family metallopeptidase [Flagellimonas hymeniacidonis]TXN34962.1 insulinase family protein [Flagellimonas hymeniacidonis]
MKYIITFLILFNLNLNCSIAQETSGPLPVDLKVRKGVLKNGLTYYIYPTDVIKDAASYYIIQNVGSVLENEDQRGLAHFLEHMAFNGTKHFEGKGVLNTLQKHGAVFGKDINAYTSFDETVYNINNIPVKESLIDTCLLIVRDWANDLLLTDEEIDAERGVIQEEWRTRQSGHMRIFEKQLPIMSNHTKYADRMPIGKMEVVMNFDPKVLRQFYQDWYRTDLQAIAIIGDVDVDMVEKKVKSLFADIKAVENPLDRVLIDIPKNSEIQYVLATDKEVKTSHITFGVRHPRKNNTKDKRGDFKDELVNKIVTSLLFKRLAEISQNSSSSFLQASMGFGELLRNSNALFVDIDPKPNQQEEAFRSVMDEITRAYRYGFLPQELEREIANQKKDYENRIKKLGDREIWRLAELIKQDFLKGKQIRDVEKEYDIAKGIMEGLTVDYLKNHFRKLLTQENRFLAITGVEGEQNLSQEKAKEIIYASERNDSLQPYVENPISDDLVAESEIVAGSVLAESVNKEIGSTTFELSNGVKVHYKFANEEENSVSLKATSNGGLSLLSDDELTSARFINYMLPEFGLASYSKTNLGKVLTGKTANVRFSISELGEHINGSSVTDDVETMFQLLYLHFVKPRFDKEAYEAYMDKVDNYLAMRSSNINEKIVDSVTVTVYGKNNPQKPIFDENYVHQVDLGKMERLYRERFNDPSDFEFFIIGDVPIDNLRTLLTKYIASIPSTGIKENWKPYNDQWVDRKIQKKIVLEMEDPKSSVRIQYRNTYEHTLRNELLARIFGDILKLRYTETLREEEGGTYGASVQSWISKRPIGQAFVKVSFDCNPQKVEQLKNIASNEIRKIAEGQVSEVDLRKTLTNYLKEREQAKSKNNYTMNLLYNYFWEGYNMNLPESFEHIVKGITTKDVTEFAKNMLDGAESYEIIFNPKV